MNLVLHERPQSVPQSVPLSVACEVLGINRSTVYRRRSPRTSDPKPGRSRQQARQPRALTEAEREHVATTLHEERFIDQPPAQVHAQLLDEGRCLCSVSTMHRILRSLQENGERRPQRPAQHHAIPRLRAQRPNEVWTWDVTKLATIHRGVYLSLYVVLDLYSRFVVAWMVSKRENSGLAKQLFEEAHARYGIGANDLTVHQDRGSPMIARSYLDLMGDLGITCSHSRPRVSNDNPFSESQFRTLKYQPDYPGRFDSVAHARAWCEDYFDWYNFHHHHSNLASFTPEQVFTGRHREVATVRQRALDQAYERNPERFVKGTPQVALPPQAVFINPLRSDDGSDEIDTAAVNFPTLRAAGAGEAKPQI